MRGKTQSNENVLETLVLHHSTGFDTILHMLLAQACAGYAQWKAPSTLTYTEMHLIFLQTSTDCKNLGLSLILSKVLHHSSAENCASHSSSPPPVTLVVRSKANASENNMEIHDITRDENTGRVSQDECSIKGTGKEYRKNVGSPREHWLLANWEAHGSWGEYGKTKSSWEKTMQKRKGSSGHELKSCSSHFTLLRGNMLCYLVEAIHQSLLRNTNNTKRTCDTKFTRTTLRAQEKTRKQKSVYKGMSIYK